MARATWFKEFSFQGLKVELIITGNIDFGRLDWR
jgi:hypothetical protein